MRTALELELSRGNVEEIVEQPVAVVAAASTWMLIQTIREEGMDYNHMTMERLSGQQGLLWVNQSYHAMHHPFTSPKPEDLHLISSEPGAIRANAYDMVINGE